MAVTIRATSIGTKFVLDADALATLRTTLRGGGLVVHPTDTVYGLAADPFQVDAVERLYVAKARPRDLAVSMAVVDAEAVFRYGERTPLAEAFCAKNLPGPFTVVLRPTTAAPAPILSKDGKIAIRVPDHPIARLLARAFGPITSTSANRHGQPSPATCEEARAQLGDAVDVYVDGGPAPLGRESTVVDLTGPKPRILRAGALPRGAVA